MRFKYNPWVSVVAALLLIAILVLTCTGCVTEAKAATTSRFTAEHAGHLQGVGNMYIITDTETGAQYLLADVPNGAGMTKLEG